MGTTGFSASFSSSFNSVFSFNMHPILGGLLAGLGFWPKTERPHPSSIHTPVKTKPETQTTDAPSSAELSSPSEEQALQATRTVVPPTKQTLRVVRFIETGMSAANASQMAGRMVISGRMSDVCAELDRLAAYT